MDKDEDLKNKEEKDESEESNEPEEPEVSGEDESEDKDLVWEDKKIKEEPEESEEPEVDEKEVEEEEQAEENETHEHELASEEKPRFFQKSEEDDDYSSKDVFYPRSKKRRGKTLLFVVILIILLGGLGFIFRHQLKGMISGKSTPSPSPSEPPVPTPTPSPLIRSDWSLEVLNGTTTSGLAKKIADQLQSLGYPVVKVGNADKDAYEKSQILVKAEMIDKVNLIVSDIKDIIKIASSGGELKEGTASARIIIGKDAVQ